MQKELIIAGVNVIQSKRILLLEAEIAFLRFQSLPWFSVVQGISHYSRSQASPSVPRRNSFGQLWPRYRALVFCSSLYRFENVFVVVVSRSAHYTCADCLQTFTRASTFFRPAAFNGSLTWLQCGCGSDSSGRGIHWLAHVRGTLMSGCQAGFPAMFLPSLLTKQKELNKELHPRNKEKQIRNQYIYGDYPLVL